MLQAPSPTVWLDNRILSWPLRPVGFAPTPDDPGARQHHLLDHVDTLLGVVTTQFTLADAIENLNKAIDQRVARLTEAFSLNDLRRNAGRNVDRYELLTTLGVIRPIMRKELNDIRNSVNHQDALPPEHDQCLRLAEFAWYFLRSTDGLVRIRELRLSLDDPAITGTVGGSVLITTVPAQGWNCDIAGAVPPQMLSDAPAVGYIRVTMSAQQYASAHVTGSGFVMNDAGLVEVAGTTLFTSEQQLAIASLTFNCAKRLV